jgi:hypothetical protein
MRHRQARERLPLIFVTWVGPGAPPHLTADGRMLFKANYLLDAFTGLNA